MAIPQQNTQAKWLDKTRGSASGTIRAHFYACQLPEHNESEKDTALNIG